MKNFDDMLSKDREFTVRGETFEWRDVRPEVLTQFDDDEPEGADEKVVWDVIDARILQFLSPEDQKRWKELRAREERPVTIAQMNELVTWLIESQTGRPTVQPSPSEVGRGRTAATSKAA